jgi:hypothetical protein
MARSPKLGWDQNQGKQATLADAWFKLMKHAEIFHPRLAQHLAKR